LRVKVKVGGVAQRAKTFLLDPGHTLFQRVVRGGVWVFALRMSRRGLSLVRTIVLARVLVPSDFGLMGLALLAMSALETFSRTGFEAALIQKKEEISGYLDTAWTISALRGFVLFVGLYVAAPYIALFFDAPAATAIMRVIGISMVCSGLTNIGVVYLQKELEFKRQFIYQLSGTVADLIVAVTAVLLLRSVWALVFGLLAGNLVQMLVSYMIHSSRPRPSLEGAKARELYAFGKWILGSSILVFLLNEGDDLFLGKTLGATALGLYQMAYSVSNLPATEITHVVSRVTFPAYSKLQDRWPRLQRAYLAAFQVTTLVSFPMAAGIFFLAPDFTSIFLGEKWMPMVPAMQVLTIWGLARSIGATTGPLFQAVGKPEIPTRLQFAKLVLLVILVYPFTENWGILGTAWAVVLNALLVIPVAVYMVIRIIGCRAWQVAKLLLVPALSTAAMGGALLVLKQWSGSSIDYPGLIGFVIVALVFYLGTIALCERFGGYGLGTVLKQKPAIGSG
jgi:lipopolysaccharide exporter